MFRLSLVIVLAATLTRGLCEEKGTPPPQVASYFQQTARQVKEALAAGKGADAGLTFKPVFFSPAREFNSSGGCWLVGFQVGGDPRSINSSVAIIDSNGHRVWQYPGFDLQESTSLPFLGTKFTDGIFVSIAPGDNILALASPASRDDPGSLELFQVTPSGSKVLYDEGKPPDAEDSNITWEGMYYFSDIDGDGRKEILINRRIHYVEGGRMVYRNQKLIYSIDPTTLKAKDVTLQHLKEIRAIFSKVKSDKSVQHIAQYGTTIQANDDLGESIFPEENQWRSIKYEEVVEPQVGIVAEYAPSVFSGLKTNAPHNMPERAPDTDTNKTSRGTQGVVSILTICVLGIIVWLAIKLKKGK